MNNTRGLLYPALHKFYNALSSLEKFEKGKNFFDNITYLDNFFSEYRSITFALQKSLEHTEFISTYERLRDEHLVNELGKWFKDKRNTVVHQQPFDLEKRIVISIYSDQEAIALPELIFTIDNDVEYSSIVESLKEEFLKISPIEVMFSAEFFFYENGHTEDLYDYFIAGINQMKLFIAAMRKTLNEECKLSDELESKIEEMNFYRVPKDMLLVDDYVFYCKKGDFEKASRIALSLETGMGRSPIENLDKFAPGGDIFDKFEMIYLVPFQMQKTLLPTCLVIYSDNTFELLTFGFSIKTTAYRKLNELSRRIEADEIINVLFVMEMYTFDLKDINHMDSSERVKYARNELLAFFMVDKNLAMKSHNFDTKRIDDWEYIVSVMSAQPSKPVLPGLMNPVIREFTRLQTWGK